MDPCGERSDKRFEFLHGVLVRLACTVAGLEKCRDPQRWHVWCVPRLRGTVSGCLSHTKVFHTVGVVSMPSYSHANGHVGRRLSLAS